jgi:hypothetical protein
MAISASDRQEPVGAEREAGRGWPKTHFEESRRQIVGPRPPQVCLTRCRPARVATAFGDSSRRGRDLIASWLALHAPRRSILRLAQELDDPVVEFDEHPLPLPVEKLEQLAA